MVERANPQNPRTGARTRILFVVNNPDFFLSHRLPIALAAHSLGYDVHVATPAYGRWREILGHGITFHPVAFSRSSARPLQEAATLVSLYRLYRRLRPDLVHHVTIKPVLYGSLVARWVGVPAVVNAVSGLGYVFLARGFGSLFRRAMVMAAYRLAFRHPLKRIIFQNPEDRQVFTDSGIVDPAETVLIRGSGVNLDAFRPVPEPDGTPLVVLVSRLLWDKGVGEFVEAAARLKAGGVRARFALVGEGDAGNPSNIPDGQIQDWVRSGTVEWWGHRADIPAVFAEANIVCLPSYREGLPKVLIEAAACGRAIVTTDVPGCREIVQHGKNGILVPARDYSSLVDAIRSLLEQPDLRIAMGGRGREMAEQEFSVEKVVEATLSLYQGLIEGSESETKAKESKAVLTSRGEE